MCLLFLTLSPVASHDLFTSVQGFAVKQPNIFSDHSQIVCWVKTGTDLSNNNDSFQEKNNVKLPQQYVWEETSAAKFTAAFRSNDIVFITSLRKYKLRFKQYKCSKCYQSIHKYYDWGSKTFIQIN